MQNIYIFICVSVLNRFHTSRIGISTVLFHVLHASALRSLQAKPWLAGRFLAAVLQIRRGVPVLTKNGRQLRQCKLQRSL